MHLICCRDIWSSSINIPLMRSGLFSSDHVYLHTCTGGYILCVWCISTYLYRWLYTLCLVHIYISVQCGYILCVWCISTYLYRWLYTLCLVHIYISVQVAIYSVFGAYLHTCTGGYIFCVWCISTYLYRWLYTLCLVHISTYLYMWLYTLCLVHIYIPVHVAIYSVFGAYLSVITSG